jgi:hypothetical protein
MIMTEDAARGWNKPIRRLWIEGVLRHESAKLDFGLWKAFLVEGGILAMRDIIRKTGRKEFYGKKCFAPRASRRLSSTTSPPYASWSRHRLGLGYKTT